MNLRSAEKLEILDRLQGVLRAPDLPAKAAASCSSLLEKLQQAVRIGVFGLPEAGKRRVINVLLQEQEQVLDQNLTLPTLNLSFGANAQTLATLQDGSSIAAEGYPSQEIAQFNPMFLQVSGPMANIEGREYLLIAADPSLEDMTAAFGWAATQVDVVLFCTQAWTNFEQQIWSAAPEALRNHAILVVTGAEGGKASQQLNVSPEDGFETIFKEQPNPLPAGNGCSFGGLTRHLQNTIAEALTEDINAAQLFLHRYGDRYCASDHAPEIDQLPEVPNPVTEPLRVASGMSEKRPQKVNAPEDAVIALSKLFQFLRRSAERLRQQFPTPRLSQNDAEHHLSALDEIFDQLAQRATEQDLLEEHWPDLCDAIHDARDLALLMRVEGGLDQVRDAAMLLLQIRQDVEFRLVA